MIGAGHELTPSSPRCTQTESRETLLGFNMVNYRACKNLWKACVEHHTFFRLERPIPPQKNFFAYYFTLGSKFRYWWEPQATNMSCQRNTREPLNIQGLTCPAHTQICGWMLCLALLLRFSLRGWDAESGRCLPLNLLALPCPRKARLNYSWFAWNKVTEFVFGLPTVVFQVLREVFVSTWEPAVHFISHFP